MMRSRVSLIAEAAFGFIEGIAKEPEAQKKKYGSLCLKLPSLLQTNGLCQTVGFLQAKAPKNPHAGLVLLHLAQLVTPGAGGGDKRQIDSFASQVRSADQLVYRDLTRKARTASVWLKRYAEAQLRVEITDDEEEDAE